MRAGAGRTICAAAAAAAAVAAALLSAPAPAAALRAPPDLHITAGIPSLVSLSRDPPTLPYNASEPMTGEFGPWFPQTMHRHQSGALLLSYQTDADTLNEDGWTGQHYSSIDGEAQPLGPGPGTRGGRGDTRRGDTRGHAPRVWKLTALCRCDMPPCNCAHADLTASCFAVLHVCLLAIVVHMQAGTSGSRSR
eukprot:SAG22_NODE_1788_length_3571_cov_3.315956_1_plen_193_part_00